VGNTFGYWLRDEHTSLGVRSREQAQGIIKAGEFRLSAAEVDEITQGQMTEAQELSLFS